MEYRSRSHKDRLGTRVEGRRLEREMQLLRVKERMERERAVKEALDIVPNLEFFCHECEQDFIGYGFKQKRVLDGNETIGFWYGYCPNLHRSIRRITDKRFDSYYRESPMVLRQALDFADDLMSPNDPRFALRYPKAYERYMTDNGHYDSKDLKLR